MTIHIIQYGRPFCRLVEGDYANIQDAVTVVDPQARFKRARVPAYVAARIPDRVSLYDYAERSFPYGLLEDVEDNLRKRGIVYKVIGRPKLGTMRFPSAWRMHPRSSASFMSRIRISPVASGSVSCATTPTSAILTTTAGCHSFDALPNTSTRSPTANTSGCLAGAHLSNGSPHTPPHRVHSARCVAFMAATIASASWRVNAMSKNVHRRRSDPSIGVAVMRDLW